MTAGLSRKHVFDQIDQSLNRLGMDYVDLLYIHRLDPDTEFDEMLDALEAVVQSGKVRYIAASSMWAWQFAKLREMQKARGYQQFIAMQNFYNLAYREEEREMMPYCASEGVGVVPWSPIARGLSCRKPAEGRAGDQSGGHRQAGAGLFRFGAGLCGGRGLRRWPRSSASSRRRWPMPGFCQSPMSRHRLSAPPRSASSKRRSARLMSSSIRLLEASIRLLEGILAYKPRMKKIERVRSEERLLKVLKGLAEHLDISVAELIEALALHAFEGKAPFGADTVVKIDQLKVVYDLDLTAADSHGLSEQG
jgi:hypothetical protein